MLISHRKQFIYTKTAKTASTSVECYFEPYCMPEGEWVFQHAREEYVGKTGVIGYRGGQGGETEWFNHMAAVTIRDKVGTSTWNDYFKFAVIRNPFDKLVSGYFFSTRHGGEAEDPVTGFRAWLREGGEIIDRHTYTIDGEICLDYFIRYESLLDGIRSVCERLNLPFEPDRLPDLKRGFRNHGTPIAQFYDGESRSIVREKYAFELDYFGYRCPQ